MDDATKIAFESIQSQIKTSSESSEKILHSGLKGIRHYVDASGEVTNIKLDSIIKDNKIRNDRIGKLEDKTLTLEQSDSNRIAIKKVLGKSFVIGCAILAAALTVVKLIDMVGN